MKRIFDKEQFLQMFIILTCLTILTFHFLSTNSKAQISCLPNRPPLFNKTNPKQRAWAPNKNVSVTIFDRAERATSDAEFNAINEGIQDWNTVKVSGCSNVTFGNAVRAGRSWDGMQRPPNDTIYVVRTTDRDGEWFGIFGSESGLKFGWMYMHSRFDERTTDLR